MKYKYEIVSLDDKIPARILWQDKPGWRCNTKPHWHKELEFVYMIDGELETVTNGQKQTIQQGDFFFCNSKDIHATSVADGQRVYKYLVVQLSYEKMQDYCEPEEDLFFSLEDETVRGDIREQLALLTGILEKEQTAPMDFSDIKRAQIILELFYILLTRCRIKKPAESRKVTAGTAYAKQLMEYINVHYADELSLDLLAKEVGLSAQYLSKHFKSATNMGIVQYINLMRLEHANRELLNDGVTVTEAAMNNGFPSVKAYIETCKKVHGMTPSCILKQAKIKSKK